MTTRKRSPIPPKTTAPLIKEKITRPNHSTVYMWCDFIELCCLFGNESRFSRGQLMEVLDDSALLYGEITDGDDKYLDSDEQGVEDDPELDEDEPISVEAPALKSSVYNENRAAEWFSNLRFRNKLFANSYPFHFSDDGQEIFLNKNIDESQRLYIQLLLSSSLRVIPKTRWPDLTEPFEAVSEKIFSALMPRGWSVHRFGAKGSTRYSGKLYDKLTALAKDIRAEFTAPPHYYHDSNTGDGGLDLVAWHSLGDDRIGIPVALAQCGCVAEEWSMKTLEASPARLRANLRAPLPWTAYYFMPHDLVYNAGTFTDWQKGNDLTESIIIDRYRFIQLANAYDLLIPDHLTTKIVDEALAFKKNAF